jgi:chorismate lyase/3-hydroxybenzoate synthase
LFRNAGIAMTQGCPSEPQPALAGAPRVIYAGDGAARLLADTGTLAVFGFGAAAAAHDDPRYLRVALQPLDEAGTCEVWRVAAPVASGRHGDVRWASGGGWLFAALELHEADHGGPDNTAETAYRLLCGFLRTRAENHVQRLWNYLAAINDGSGDDERYRQFCEGRARGMADFFAGGFPAATAIGHRGPAGLLQVYCLAATQPGTRVENPRQLSAWRYPRQYGRTPPSFARAMRLPGDDALAISGTAAIIGHQSQHAGDLRAQLDETRANLEALLRAGDVPAGFTADASLKAYVRHVDDAAAVDACLAAHMPAAPRLLLQGDICRRELLVEIDGWRYR